MSELFQKFRIFFVIVSCGMILLGLALWDGRKEEFLIMWSIPGFLLGVYLYFTRPVNKQSFTTKNQAEELLKWHQLKESGAISDEEFNKKKKEILN